MSDKILKDWYQEIGIDTPVSDRPTNKLAAVSPPSEQAAKVDTIKQVKRLTKDNSAIASARELAQQATTLEELKAAFQEFDGCALKKTAMNLVFADGNPKASIMAIGEAPGADEDKQGKPFVGQSGQLLDKIFASIGLSRDNLYITNIVPWRPPGNRQPTRLEAATCFPFTERHIQLMQPKLVLLVGGTAAKTLLNTSEGIMQLRGQFMETTLPEFQTKAVTFATFHPAYLLRSPLQKRLVWQDMLTLKAYINKHGL